MQTHEAKAITNANKNSNVNTVFRKPKNEHGNFSSYQFGTGDEISNQNESVLGPRTHSQAFSQMGQNEKKNQHN